MIVTNNKKLAEKIRPLRNHGSSPKEKYKNLIYLVIGEGEEKNRLEKLTKKLKIENFVQFLGQLPHQRAMEYISICDIFSLPSWNEGFGVVYLEAMAHGKPAIACQGQGIEDVIKDKINGLLVSPQNIEELIEAFDYLLSSPEKTKKIGIEAQKTILENYTWREVVKKIINIYKNFL